MKFIEFHLRIKKIMKILELHKRITKIIKIKKNHMIIIEIMEIINFKVDYELNHIKKEDVLDSEQKLEHEANVKILEKLMKIDLNCRIIMNHSQLEI